MAHILPDRDLYAWCHHGTPLGHACQWCHHEPGQPAAVGWLCVGCHRVWNPAVLACHHCPGPEQPEPLGPCGNPP